MKKITLLLCLFSLSFTVTAKHNTFTGSSPILKSNVYVTDFLNIVSSFRTYSDRTVMRIPIHNGSCINPKCIEHNDNIMNQDAFNFDLAETSFMCPSSFPINEDFDSASLFSTCYIVEDLDSDGAVWVQQTLDLNLSPPDETFAICSNNGIVQDNWLFSPPLTLVSGADYDFNFTFNGFDGVSPANESLEVVLIDAASSSGNILTTLYSATGIVQSGTVMQLETMATSPNVNYTSTASGTYYLAFRMFSPASDARLLLFDYSIDQTLGINDFDSKSFSHFYDPGTDMLTLKSSINPFSRLELFNILGQNVINKTLFGTKESIDLANLTDGIYIARVKIDDKLQTLKILKR